MSSLRTYYVNLLCGLDQISIMRQLLASSCVFMTSRRRKKINITENKWLWKTCKMLLKVFYTIMYQCRGIKCFKTTFCKNYSLCAVHYTLLDLNKWSIGLSAPSSILAYWFTPLQLYIIKYIIKSAVFYAYFIFFCLPLLRFSLLLQVKRRGFCASQRLNF